MAATKVDIHNEIKNLAKLDKSEHLKTLREKVNKVCLNAQHKMCKICVRVHPSVIYTNLGRENEINKLGWIWFDSASD